MRELYYDENRAYSLNPGDGHKPCLLPVDGSYTGCTRPVDEPLTQDRKDKDRKDKDSTVQDREAEREHEGEIPPPAVLTPEERKERILFWKKRVSFLREQSYPADSMYSLAAAQDGITREEIDGYEPE
jgi:hypothetical protein